MSCDRQLAQYLTIWCVFMNTANVMTITVSPATSATTTTHVVYMTKAAQY